ncbi:MAG: DNA replication/repair protein RecF [Acidimicrobiales bacterium]
MNRRTTEAPGPTRPLPPAAVRPAARLSRLSLVSFRNWGSVALVPAPSGLTVLSGPTGAGKTSLLEAVGFLGTRSSPRGASAESLVRQGDQHAQLMAEADVGGRRITLEARIGLRGTNRFTVNGKADGSAGGEDGMFPVVWSGPEDIAVVKEGPAVRRSFLDQVLRSTPGRHGAACTEYDRLLRRRSALLRQAALGGVSSLRGVLEAYDEKLAAVGHNIAAARELLCAELAGPVVAAYAGLSGAGAAGSAQQVALGYQQSWAGPLQAALHDRLAEDVRRQQTGVGPHRDDLDIRVDGRRARFELSQGEQRGLVLALRIGAYAVVTARTGRCPVMLLDDVFAELDAARSEALAVLLPPHQTLLTTSTQLPPGLEAALTVELSSGSILATVPSSNRERLASCATG